MTLEYTPIHSVSQYYQPIVNMHYSVITSQLGTTITIIFGYIIEEFNDKLLTFRL